MLFANITIKWYYKYYTNLFSASTEHRDRGKRFRDNLLGLCQRDHLSDNLWRSLPAICKPPRTVSYTKDSWHFSLGRWPKENPQHCTVFNMNTTALSHLLKDPKWLQCYGKISESTKGFLWSCCNVWFKPLLSSSATYIVIIPQMCFIKEYSPSHLITPMLLLEFPSYSPAFI